MSRDVEFTVLFPFCGLGAGALGFLEAQVSLLGRRGRFRSIGGIDLDPLACADFETLTESPALCADVATMTPADLRTFAGAEAPDVVFFSPPCKGFSGLLSKRASGEARYQRLNRLVLDWTRLMLATWRRPPRLVLLENVPRISSRGRHLLDEVKALFSAAGYVFHASAHDCGELGGLAQHRQRFLLVARHPGQCPPLLYQPIKRRVRGCGEVLGLLPMPGDPAAGPLHELPLLRWKAWIQLALIPAGGDWRDLPGVLAEGEQRRAKFRRHRVERWDAPCGAVAGGGSNGVGAIADPRGAAWIRSGSMGVKAWGESTGAITGNARPSTGAFSVSDPRIAGADVSFGCKMRAGVYGVLRWDQAAKTVIGAAGIDNGSFAVADPRVPDAPPIEIPDLRARPAAPPVIIAADGTWHRPLTRLDLAALQGLPATVRGRPLTLAGSSASAHVERIGNAVPPPAARAIAERMLVALVEADAGGFSLSSGGAVWVRPEAAVLQ